MINYCIYVKEMIKWRRNETLSEFVSQSMVYKITYVKEMIKWRRNETLSEFVSQSMVYKIMSTR